MIKERINLGKEILKKVNATGINLSEIQMGIEKWRRGNIEYLIEEIGIRIVEEEYRPYANKVLLLEKTFSGQKREISDALKEDISKLNNISQRLGKLKEVASKGEVGDKCSDSISKSDIFLVHGHDNELKELVARFLEKIGLNVIILHEQPNQGKTIIEKFEEYAHVNFALIILSQDDLGNRKDKIGKAELNFRARQNVIFEHGFFIGKLGRNRVIALKKGELEIPSDLKGVLYINLESADWKIEVCKELYNAGLKILMNNLLT